MKNLAVLVGAVVLAGVAQAQVTVAGPWVRTTVAQQTTTAAYLSITAVQGGKLVWRSIQRRLLSGSSPISPNVI